VSRTCAKWIFGMTSKELGLIGRNATLAYCGESSD
jgi:hypothetical protein